MEAWRRELSHTELYHFGIKERSGRRPWGSGERPYQRLGGKKQQKALKIADKDTKNLTPEEISAKKESIVKSRSATALYRNKELFTNRELTEALGRLNTESKIKQLSDAEIAAGKKFLKRLDKTQRFLEKTVSYYETYKKVSRALDEITNGGKKK